MIHMLHQAHLLSICCSDIYKYGYQVPCTPKEAIELDKKNGNTKHKTQWLKSFYS